jgi:ligand-binding sensor domain-containing protein
LGEEQLKRSVIASNFKLATIAFALLGAFAVSNAMSSTWQPSPLEGGQTLGFSSDLSIEQLHHTAFTAENGAPQFASSIAQDSRGFLWFVSNGGLYRFDGVKFDRTLGSKLPPGPLLTVYGAPSGDLWIGYLLGGIARVHDGQITFYPFGKDIPSGTPFDFRQTPDGILWVGCTNGLARFVNGTWQMASKEYGYDGRRLTQMVTTRDGSLWIGGINFAMVLRPGSHRFVEVPLGQAEEEILRSPNVEWWHQGTDSGQRMRDNSGAIWMGSAQGIRRFRNASDARGDGDLAVDTFTTAQGLSDNDIIGLYGDREGDVWVATVRGIDQFRANRVTPFIFDKTVLQPTVAFDAENTAWVGNIWSGYRIPSDLKPEAAPVLGTFVSVIAADQDGTIWFANDNGLNKMAGHNAIAVLLPRGVAAGEFTNSYRAIAFGPNNVTWLSIAGAGLYALKNGQWQRDGGLQGLPDDLALSMSFDHDGRLWILYSDGRIALVDHSVVRVYTKADGLNIGEASAISAARDPIWVAGNAGIARFDGSKFIALRLADARLSEGITGLVQLQNGDLWAHGNGGLIWVSKKEIDHAIGDPSYAVRTKVFGSQDGVIGITDKGGPFPTLVLSRDGRLWVSTVSSVAWIDPRYIVLNEAKPYPIIDTLIADDKYYPGDQVAKLPVGTRNLRIMFTAASLRSPSEVRFKYKLDGVDHDWENGQEEREVSYTNLDHGEYAFHVRAVNEDGIAGDHEANFRFTIAPAFYEMRWFQLLCVAFVAIALWRLYVMRVNYLLGMFRAKVHERERIARELHDTLLQSVQGL